MEIKIIIFEEGIPLTGKFSLNNQNYILVRKKLESTKQDIIEHLRELKKEGVIKSIYRPINKDFQKMLNELVKAKRIITNSINTIKELYYK